MDIEDHRKEQEKERKRQADQYASDFQHVANSAQGRRVLWRLMADAGVFRSSWAPAEKIHFNEGQRNMGLRIFSDIATHCPEALQAILAQHKENLNG